MTLTRYGLGLLFVAGFPFVGLSDEPQLAKELEPLAWLVGEWRWTEEWQFGLDDYSISGHDKVVASPDGKSIRISYRLSREKEWKGDVAEVITWDADETALKMSGTVKFKRSDDKLIKSFDYSYYLVSGGKDKWLVKGRDLTVFRRFNEKEFQRTVFPVGGHRLAGVWSSSDLLVDTIRIDLKHVVGRDMQRD